MMYIFRVNSSRQAASDLCPALGNTLHLSLSDMWNKWIWPGHLLHLPELYLHSRTHFGQTVWACIDTSPAPKENYDRCMCQERKLLKRLVLGAISTMCRDTLKRISGIDALSRFLSMYSVWHKEPGSLILATGVICLIFNGDDSPVFDPTT